MSKLEIQERFSLEAPPEETWRFLIDPNRVVNCLPGAELLGQTDEITYRGAVRVKIGAVTVAYSGVVVFEDVDHDQRHVTLVGRGRERTGSGTASMTMEIRVESSPGGGSTVTVEAQVKLAGKIVRFGRGMIQTVSEELFSEFTRQMAAELDGGGVSDDDRDAATGQPPHTPADDDTSRAADTPEVTSGSPTTPATQRSIALLPLLWGAFRRWLRRLFD
jgi:carbon monoxide dehydrogenase subunit G